MPTTMFVLVWSGMKSLRENAVAGNKHLARRKGLGSSDLLLNLTRPIPGINSK